MYEWSLEQRRKDDTPTFENRAIHSVKNSPKFIDLFIYQFHRYNIISFLLWYHTTVKGIKCQINFSQITWKFCFVFSEISYMYMYLWISLFFPPNFLFLLRNTTALSILFIYPFCTRNKSSHNFATTYSHEQI